MHAKPGHPHPYTQALYISQCMTEVKKELKLENATVKANAISKLTYVRASLIPRLLGH